MIAAFPHFGPSDNLRTHIRQLSSRRRMRLRRRQGIGSLFHRVEIEGPGQCRAPKALPLRRQFGPLADSAETQIDETPAFQARRVNRRSAGAAKVLDNLSAASAALAIGAGLAVQGEPFDAHPHARAIGRAGKRLAVCAVADHDAVGVDFRLIGDLAAVAPAVDLEPHCSLRCLSFLSGLNTTTSSALPNVRDPPKRMFGSRLWGKSGCA